jgi:hypothetical protein
MRRAKLKKTTKNKTGIDRRTFLAAATAASLLQQREADAKVVDTLEAAEWAKCRGNFPLFRRAIRKDMLWDWWPQEVSERLQGFYDDLIAGKRPKMCIMLHRSTARAYPLPTSLPTLQA